MAANPAEPKPPLVAYRVLDLSDQRGLLCGQLMADLGADVVVVEPPGGSPVRRLAPFYQDRPDPNGSLYWWAYNRNKRGVTLELGADIGRAIFLQLVSTADFLLESATPGHMAGQGLGYEDLAAQNPRLIYVSITPYGQTGPKAKWAASDLTVLAAGGPLALTGDHDRPPLRVAVPQAYLHAAADGALGAMIAHFDRLRTGRGQHVDVSGQESVTIATQSGALAEHFNATPFRRHRGGLRLGVLENQIIWPAKDGHVTMAVAFGANAGPFMVSLQKFLYQQSHLPDADPELRSLGPLLAGAHWPQEARDQMINAIRAFTSRRTKAELMDMAQRNGVLIGSLETLPDVAASPQLEHRGYWRALEHRELGRAFNYPGPFARFNATPIQYHRPAPTVGEHNREIFIGELGMTELRMAELHELGII
jgi:crotonobetainyl-CoA:carnitine CoA-transferase CaiB-like acyl-CoA transferase